MCWFLVMLTVSDSRSVDYIFSSGCPVRESIYIRLSDAWCSNQRHFSRLVNSRRHCNIVVKIIHSRIKKRRRSSDVEQVFSGVATGVGKRGQLPPQPSPGSILRLVQIWWERWRVTGVGVAMMDKYCINFAYKHQRGNLHCCLLYTSPSPRD